MILQDSLVLDVEREESATSFFCNPRGEIFHHATLWYKTRITIYDTSLVKRKTAEFPGIIDQIQAMHDTVFIYQTRGGDCDKCLMVYYDTDFHKLGQVDAGFYFEHYRYLRTIFRDLHRLADGRFVITDETDLDLRILSAVGINDSLKAQVPFPCDLHDGTRRMQLMPLKSNAHSVYIWAFPSKLYTVDIGVLGLTETNHSRKVKEIP